jgi:porcupine-like protein
MTTFLASTFLHGFNFQLGAVLLSLGFFSYVDNKLRSRLALIFDASVTARKSPHDNFKYKEASFPVMIANFGFGILTCVHLMYLGVMFDQQDLQTEGYRWQHTIAKWESLGFFSHWIMAGTFLLSFVL